MIVIDSHLSIPEIDLVGGQHPDAQARCQIAVKVPADQILILERGLIGIKSHFQAVYIYHRSHP